MENNIQNKRRLFDLYAGQKVFINHMLSTDPVDLKREWIDLLADENEDSSGKYEALQLKSLSVITEYDLKKLVEIILPYLKDPIFIISKGYTKNGRDICKSVICIEVTEFIDIINSAVLYSLIQVDTEESDIITGMFENDGKSLRDDATDNILHAYDFLRYEGYALPFMGLSVDELVSRGWIELVIKNEDGV